MCCCSCLPVATKERKATKQMGGRSIAIERETRIESPSTWQLSPRDSIGQGDLSPGRQEVLCPMRCRSNASSIPRGYEPLDGQVTSPPWASVSPSGSVPSVVQGEFYK